MDLPDMQSFALYTSVDQRLLHWRLTPLKRLLLIPLACIGSILGLLHGSWTLVLSLVNGMTAYSIPALRKQSHAAKRRQRWIGAFLLALWIATFNPSFAASLMATYCLMRSFEIHHRWLEWMIAYGQQKSSNSFSR